MMGRWVWLDAVPASNAWNMAFDEWALQWAAQLKAPILRSYTSSEGGATFGYFQALATVESMTECRPLIRRTTGGGVVPHDADWTYAIAIPVSHPWYLLRAHDSYQRLHDAVAGALRALGVSAQLAPEASVEGPGQCFVGAEANDVLLGGRKIAGAAQRRRRDGLLIQGSVQPVPTGLDRRTWFRAFAERLALPHAVEVLETTPQRAIADVRALERTVYANPEFIGRR